MERNGAKPLLFWIGLFLIELALALAAHDPDGVSTDVAIHINTAQRMMHGEQLYRDIIAVNLPIIFFLRYPAVALSERFGWSLFNLTMLIDNLFALLALVGALLVLRRASFARTSGQLGFLLVSLGFALLLMPGLEKSDGEKEFYCLLFTLPYFLMVALQDEETVFSPGERALVTCVGALGFAVKPTCAFTFIFVESYRCLRDRSLRPLLRLEFFLVIGLGALYSLWMRVYFPGYLTTVVPFARYYFYAKAYKLSFWVYTVKKVVPFVVAWVLLGVSSLYLRAPFRRFSAILLVASAGYLMNSLVQGKPYGHHFYPFYASVLIVFATACACAWAEPGRGLDDTPRRPPQGGTLRQVLLAVAVVGLAVQWWTYALADSETVKPDVLGRVMALAAHHHRPAGGGAPLVFELSFWAAPMFPTGIKAGLPWKFHFCELWLMNGIERFKEAHRDRGEAWNREQTAPAQELLFATVADDIRSQRPDFLLVDWDWERHVNLYDYFHQDGRFARLIGDYQYLEYYKGFSIFVRR